MYPILSRALYIHTPNTLLLGGSGIALAREAISFPDGPKLTLYVRTPSKLPADLQKHARIRVVEGSLRDSRKLSDAMTGVTSVVSVLGAYISLGAFVSRDTSTSIADSFPTIFAAMREKGVKRILALSTAAYMVPEDRMPWNFYRYSWLPYLMAPQGNAEMKAIAEQLAAQDDLEWTIMRVPHLNDGHASLNVYADVLGPGHVSMELSRASMGRWILRELKEGRWIKKAPEVCNQE